MIEMKREIKLALRRTQTGLKLHPSTRMPVRNIWDHTIDLKDDFKASKARVYSLSRNKKEEVQKFINKHLKKGYIHPSKSSQTSLVFFVRKKDEGKHMIVERLIVFKEECCW